MTNTAIAEPPVNKILNHRPLAEIDPAIHTVLEDEKQRQSTHIELIALKNFTLPATIETTGSVLTNKYAEGYPAKRYYGDVNMLMLQKVWQLNGQKFVWCRVCKCTTALRQSGKYSGIFRDASTG